MQARIGVSAGGAFRRGVRRPAQRRTCLIMTGNRHILHALKRPSPAERPKSN